MNNNFYRVVIAPHGISSPHIADMIRLKESTDEWCESNLGAEAWWAGSYDGPGTVNSVHTWRGQLGYTELYYAFFYQKDAILFSLTWK